MRQKRIIEKALFLPSILILAGCVAGGIFFEHSAPSAISHKEEALVSLTVSVNAGDARPLEVQLHYRLSGSKEHSFVVIPMNKTESEKEEVKFECSIPAAGVGAVGKDIEVFFELTGPHKEDHSFYLKENVLKITVK